MFLQRVTELIDSHGITRNKLLTEIGLNKNSFVVWENRGTVPGGNTLSKLADYFHVSTDYLLGRTDNPQPVGGGVESNPQPVADLTTEEMDMVEAYRAADSRTRQIVDLNLEPWKKRKSSEEAM